VSLEPLSYQAMALSLLLGPTRRKRPLAALADDAAPRPAAPAQQSRRRASSGHSEKIKIGLLKSASRKLSAACKKAFDSGLYPTLVAVYLSSFVSVLMMYREV
jgi:hypothetical protein